MKFYAVFAGLTLFFLLFSCNKERSEKTPSDPSEKEQQIVLQTEKQQAADRSNKEITLKRVTDQKAESAVEINLKGKEALLYRRQGSRIIPEDFKIGPLQDSLDPGNKKGLTLIIEQFLKSLTRGEIEEDLLIPSDRTELSRFLAYHIGRGLIPRSYRFGSINLDDPTLARANVRLFSETGVSEGEIYLTKEDGLWYITDLQIAFEKLSITYQQSDQKFIPYSYGWTIQF
jgi:hypothetical protein